MKAVASDMVLTFCSRSPNSQLYSLLLSREHILQKSDKRGVHNLLGRRGLKILSIRETCVNGGAGSRRNALDLTAWTILVGLLSSSYLLRPWQWWIRWMIDPETRSLLYERPCLWLINATVSTFRMVAHEQARSSRSGRLRATECHVYLRKTRSFNQDISCSCSVNLRYFIASRFSFGKLYQH